MQEELQDQRAVAREMALERADVLEALLPDVLVDEFARQLLTRQESPDGRARPALPRSSERLKMPMRPRSGSAMAVRHRKSWSSSSRARRLEGVDLAALRVDARHDVLDRAVLAGGVHRLEHRQHRPAVLGVELLLQVGKPFYAVGEHRLGVVLADVEAEGVGRIDGRRGGNCPACRRGYEFRVIAGLRKSSWMAPVHAVPLGLASRHRQ